MFAQRRPHVLHYIEATEQGAVLKQHTDATSHLQGLLFGQSGNLFAEDTDRARCRRLQQSHFTQQRGLSAAATTDDGQYFTLAHAQVEVFVDHLATETH